MRIVLLVFGWAVAAVSGVLLLAGGILAGARGASFAELLWGWSIAEWAVGWTFALVGAVLTTRRERHLVAWLIAAIGLGVATSSCASHLRAFVETDGGSKLASAALGWLGPNGLLVAIHPDSVGLLAVLLILFPHGRPLSSRWRWLVYAVAAAMAVAMLASWGVLPAYVYDRAELVWLVSLPLGATSLVWRIRRADRDEKQQLKVVAYATVVVVVGFFAGAFAGVAPVTNALLFPLIPGSVGIAITRYHLYEIDRIVSRTVSYALLSGVLVSVYAVGVIVLSRVLAPVGGGSDLAVAVGTLAAAGVFQPARRRIQGAVDRRFNRRRYDAVRTIDDFSARLRHEVDLDNLRSDLVDVVARTMEPAGVSLWLRTPTARR